MTTFDPQLLERIIEQLRTDGPQRPGEQASRLMVAEADRYCTAAGLKALSMDAFSVLAALFHQGMCVGYEYRREEESQAEKS